MMLEYSKKISRAGLFLELSAIIEDNILTISWQSSECPSYTFSTEIGHHIGAQKEYDMLAVVVGLPRFLFNCVSVILNGLIDSSLLFFIEDNNIISNTLHFAELHKILDVESFLTSHENDIIFINEGLCFEHSHNFLVKSLFEWNNAMKIVYFVWTLKIMVQTSHIDEQKQIFFQWWLCYYL